MKIVSFIIIAYNEEKYISYCIDSILSLKDLEKYTYEIIVVDDCSSDNTATTVDNLIKINTNIHIISNGKNEGRGFSRNIGVTHAKGDYIAFVDADIRLPQHWLNICMEYLSKYEAVGGIAVPDGDVAYIYNKFKLTPKIVAHTTALTGNNCIYHREVFLRDNFNSKLRDGEDVEFNLRVEKEGYKLHSIKDLVVEHKESKSYFQELRWLYESGIGANRLFTKLKIFRFPDISFFLFLISFVISIVLSYFVDMKYISLFLIYPLLISFLHLRSKFRIEENVIKTLAATICNYSFICAYFWGRIKGLIDYKNYQNSKYKEQNEIKKILKLL